MKRSRFLSTAALSWGSVFLLLLWLAPTSSSAQSTISVYVPGYRSENWEDLAGSVVAIVRFLFFFFAARHVRHMSHFEWGTNGSSSLTLAGHKIQDSTATTYTIFCLDTADCEISGPFPFTFAEDPSTFQYSGTVASKL